MSMMQMLFNTPLSVPSGTWFFWEFTSNNGGTNLGISDLRFTSSGTVYPPNMTSSSAPSPYVCASTVMPDQGTSQVFRLFDAADTGGITFSSWPVVISLFVGPALPTPTEFTVSIGASVANRTPRDFGFYMGNSSTFASASLLKAVTGQTWSGAAEKRTYIIP